MNIVSILLMCNNLYVDDFKTPGWNAKGGFVVSGSEIMSDELEPFRSTPFDEAGMHVEPNIDKG